ncbi:MAG: 2-oxo acid dehydrogenase subunit E2 [Chloroflexi bacterium]|nr:2-oxo acid dehydrogenase subunit E2 [Chloroflexota bacterium]
MADEYALPDLGEGIEEAEVIGVLVHVGDVVEADQPLIEVETEKANLDVPSPHAGVVEAVLVEVGEVIHVGQAIVSIAPTNGASSPPLPAAVEAPSTPPAADGNGAPPSAPVAPTPAAAAPQVPAPPPSFTPTPASAPALEPEGRSVAASPAVRLFAREIGVRIGDVSGSGPGGRVSLEDVKAHARALLTQLYASPPTTAPPAPAAPAPAPTSEAGVPPPAGLPDLAAFGEIERERMSPTRRATARNLAQSWAQSPHITLQQKADVTQLDALRRERRDAVAASGGSLTMLPILMQVVARALAEFPRLNASIDMATQETVYRRYIHVGVATDTERGLVVPVVRDADQKSLTELAVEIRELAEKARDRKLSIDDMRGGTFTISNLGGMGTGFFTAILHPPQVGILAVGRAEREPLWVDDGFQPRLRMPLGLTVDHRLIDGADAARALSWIVGALEEPPELVV